MNVLLVNPLVREWAAANWTPLGLLYIAAELKRLGHSAEIYDINALRPSVSEIVKKIGEAQYDWLGLTGIITTYKNVKQLAELSKELHPERPVVLGGPLASSIPHIIIAKVPAIDFIVQGEGERVVLDLCRQTEQHCAGEPITDRIFRAERPLSNLNDLPMPDRDLVPMSIYLKNPLGAYNKRKWTDGEPVKDVISTNIMAGRGCPYACTYCAHDFMGHKYRVRSARHVMAEIVHLRQTYEVQYINFIDDEFCANRDFVLDFIEQMLWFQGEYLWPLKWGCTGRVNLVDEELLSQLASTGCIHMSFGIESGSPKILDAMNKRVTVDQAEHALALAKRYIKDVATTYMVGYPGETEDTLKETVQFIKKVGIKPDAVFYCTPYPGTELYRNVLDAGLIQDEETYVLSLEEQGRKIALNVCGLPDEVLVAYKTKMGALP